jgi:ribonuclease-3
MIVEVQLTEADLRLLERLGYAFEDAELLDRALTHRSAGARNNERLEFLGDAILGFVVAELLYQAEPDAHEGRLTRLRAHLVRRETLAAIARQLELGEVLRLGPGELKSGGRGRDSILADAFEAVIGAVYLDSGMASCRALLETLYRERLSRAAREVGLKDAKTRLQEVLQGQGRALPQYTVAKLEGAAHDQSFTVECLVDGIAGPVTGTGSSRRKAEQDAASRALEELDGDG